MPHEDKIQEILIKLENVTLQLNRIISDIESEKGIRKERSAEIERRLRQLENWQSKWGGALITLGILATIVSVLSAFIKFN